MKHQLQPFFGILQFTLPWTRGQRNRTCFRSPSYNLFYYKNLILIQISLISKCLCYFINHYYSKKNLEFYRHFRCKKPTQNQHDFIVFEGRSREISRRRSLIVVGMGPLKTSSWLCLKDLEDHHTWIARKSISARRIYERGSRKKQINWSRRIIPPCHVWSRYNDSNCCWLLFVCIICLEKATESHMFPNNFL